MLLLPKIYLLAGERDTVEVCRRSERFAENLCFRMAPEKEKDST